MNPNVNLNTPTTQGNRHRHRPPGSEGGRPQRAAQPAGWTVRVAAVRARFGWAGAARSGVCSFVGAAGACVWLALWQPGLEQASLCLVSSPQIPAAPKYQSPHPQHQHQPHPTPPTPNPQANLPSAAAYDLVIANILRGPLLELQPRLTHYVKPGGRLALSGILQEQVEDVKAAYGPCFEGFGVETDGSWALVTARRRRG